MKTDFELVMEIKNGNEKSLVELYMRYQSQIYKYASKCKSFLRSEEIEDFKSDAFFSLQTAVKYFKLEKITDPDNWKFCGIFKYFLLKQYYAYYKKYKVNVHLDYLENDMNFSYHDEPLLDMCKQNFFNQLTNEQKDILRDRRNGKTINEIRNKYGKSFGWVHTQIYKAKKIASKEFDVVYDYV